MDNVNIKHVKIMHIVNTNTLRGRLSENYLIRKYIAWAIRKINYAYY